MYTPNYNNAMMQNEPEQGGSMGSLIGVIIIVAIIVLGGIYFWGKRSASEEPGTVNGEVQSLENDLNAADISIDAELNAVDSSLQGQ